MLVASVLVVAGLLGVAVSSAVAVTAWRQRPTPGAVPLVWLMGSVGLWIIVRLSRLFAHEATTKALLASVEWAPICATGIAWLVFAVTYTGRTELLTPARLAVLVAIAATTVVVSLTNDAHGLFRTSWDVLDAGGLDTFDSSPGPYYWAAISYVYLLILGGVWLLVSEALDIQRYYRIQKAVLIVGALVPTVASLPYVFGAVSIDITPYVLPISGVACLVAVQRYRLLDAQRLPVRVVRETVVDQMDDAVMVVDDANRIVDANESARHLLSISGEAESVETVLPVYEDLSDGRQTVRVHVGRGSRLLEIGVTPMEDTDSALSGRIIVLRDVTKQHIRTQRLSVLNRILRHNLRNRMNVVLGHAETLDGADAAVIEDNAKRITQLGNKAVKTQHLLDEMERDHTVTDVRTLVDGAVEALRLDHPRASISADVAVRDPSGCDRGLEAVLIELVENGLKHNEAQTPTVRLSVVGANRLLQVRVEDNGSGLPEVEQAVLTQERERPLEHGSGLGLWLVRWSVTALGGDICCETPESGTVITVTVPTVDIG